MYTQNMRKFCRITFLCSGGHMENKLYSIGEVAKIMGISVQLLRHYCDIHLIEPEYVNQETGYRYFSYRQIPYIDRTRYLLSCGLQLKEIKEILEKDDPKALRELLAAKEEQKREELKKIRESIERIAWYRQYFARENLQLESPMHMEVKTFPDRYMIAVPCESEESYEEMHIHLHRVRYLPEYAHLTFMRQFSILLDYPALIQGKFLLKGVDSTTVRYFTIKAERKAAGQ